MSYKIRNKKDAIMFKTYTKLTSILIILNKCPIKKQPGVFVEI